MKRFRKLLCTGIFIFICMTVTGFGLFTKKEPEMTTTTVSIKIDYEKAAFAYNDKVKIYVDGNNIGKMNAGNDKQFDISLVEGTHKIWAKRDALFRKYNTNKVEFSTNKTTIYFTLVEDPIVGLKMTRVDDDEELSLESSYDDENYKDNAEIEDTDYSIATNNKVSESEKSTNEKNGKESENTSINSSNQEKQKDYDKNHTKSDESVSDEEILRRAKIRSGAPLAQLDGIDEDGNIVIHLYEVITNEGEDGHTATWDWYYINPNTLKGTDFLGEPVDLNEVDEYEYDSSYYSNETIPEYYVCVNAPDGYVNLRSGPGIEYDVICEIQNGEALEKYLEESTATNGKKWAKVAYWTENGWIDGWVIASQIE
ncbi:SH3 domain-containing protein [Butyrivibrio sp. AE3004]|uniref:SH3 domain-containing protein n=1 Tax=Butyrivibrio sp. AE3004 TaxID=1506994 RepID=UPI00049469B0|nr:SH3 domain-containing protein [Butyrivibrio sp. AE3004]